MKYRKHVRIKDFDYSSNGAYFITICANNRLDSISGQNKIIVENELISITDRFPSSRLDYYALMPNHIHFILFLDGSKVGIPQIVQAFKSLTTLKIKRGGFSEKRFWQQNYYEHVIRNRESLDRIRKYIHENPLAEGINWGMLDKGKASQGAGKASFATTKASKHIFPSPHSGEGCPTPVYRGRAG